MSRGLPIPRASKAGHIVILLLYCRQRERERERVYRKRMHDQRNLWGYFRNNYSIDMQITIYICPHNSCFPVNHIIAVRRCVGTDLHPLLLVHSLSLPRFAGFDDDVLQ